MPKSNTGNAAELFAFPQATVAIGISAPAIAALMTVVGSTVIQQFEVRQRVEAVGDARPA